MCLEVNEGDGYCNVGRNESYFVSCGSAVAELLNDANDSIADMTLV